MEVFFAGLTTESWYFYYLNGILFLLVASVFLVIPEQIRKIHHFSFLIGATVIAGISRLFLSLFLIFENLLLDTSQFTLQVVAILLGVEYGRRNWKKAFGFELPPMVHLPLALILSVVLYFTRDLFVGVGGISFYLLALTLLYQIVVAIKKADHPRLYHVNLFVAFLFLLLTIQFLAGFWGFQSLSGAGAKELLYKVGPAQLLNLVFLVFFSFSILLIRSLHAKLFYPQDGGWTAFPAVFFVLLLLIVNFSGAAFSRLMIIRETRRITNNLEKSKEGLEKLIQQRMSFAKTSSSLMSATPAFVTYLDSPNETNGKILQNVLKSFDLNFPDGICYIMDRKGLVLASSDKQELFVGRFLDFRNYFQAAMAGKNGVLIDYGKFTNELGFYSAHPIKRAETDEIVGVCAVKRNMNDLVSYLSLYRESLLIDPSGRVFLASDPGSVGKTVEFTSLGPVKERHVAGQKKLERIIVSSDSSFYTRFGLNAGDWSVVIIADSTSIDSVKVWSFSFFTLFSLVFIFFFIGSARREELLLAQRSAESRFESILFNAPEGIIIIAQADQKILLANQGFERMFELSENPAGKFYKEFLALPRTDFRKVEHLKNDGSFLHERDFLKRSGEKFSVEVKGSSTIFNGQRAIILFLRDISQRISYENKLQQAKTFAENASKIKSRFLAHTSHEIRTPLTAIIGLNEMARKICSSKEQQKLLDLASDSARSLLDILNDVLDLSQIESGTLKIVPGPFSLFDLFEQLTNMARLRAEQKKIIIETKIDTNVPEMLIADQNRLRQVLANLVSHAIKNTGIERILIEVWVIERRESDLLLKFLVRDNRTVAVEKVDLVQVVEKGNDDFDPWKDAIISGLELSISRQIIEKMGGQLKVEFDEKNGNSFFVELQVQVAAQEFVEKEDRKDRAQQAFLTHMGKPLEILVADDNETNLFLASSIIKEFGGNADCARDGREALGLLKDKSYDLALLDIMMPNLDGLETIAHIRKLETGVQQLPIIALSAFSTEEEREKAVSAGANHYLAKPYFPIDLLQAIEKVYGMELDRKQNGNAAKAIPTQERAVEKSAKTGELLLKQINLRELEVRILHKPENIRQIREIFSKRSKTLLEELAQSIEESDCVKLREISHSIKGLAGMLAAGSAFSLALQIEQLARDGKLTEAEDQVPLLIARVNEIAEDLEAICANFEEK
jgi:PAS domain S-box-containing protein